MYNNIIAISEWIVRVVCTYHSVNDSACTFHGILCHSIVQSCPTIVVTGTQVGLLREVKCVVIMSIEVHACTIVTAGSEKRGDVITCHYQIWIDNLNLIAT